MKIISGGQTGVDRAALDAAIELGIPHGGFVPKGRLAEDGAIPSRYLVSEISSSDYALRTEINVLAAHATLIFYREKLSGGTYYTWILCKKHKKPFCLVDLAVQGSPAAAGEVVQFLKKEKPGILNVAGPRESNARGIYKEAKTVLLEALKPDRKPLKSRGPNSAAATN
ncbi:MAG: putative molybdenum carrier protein [Elusimicrobia bacterium]|nr:putative molybdenum carrier protein [Elusimicrobiota bacterium]